MRVLVINDYMCTLERAFLDEGHSVISGRTVGQGVNEALLHSQYPRIERIDKLWFRVDFYTGGQPLDVIVASLVGMKFKDVQGLVDKLVNRGQRLDARLLCLIVPKPLFLKRDSGLLWFDGEVVEKLRSVGLGASFYSYDMTSFGVPVDETLTVVFFNYCDRPNLADFDGDAVANMVPRIEPTHHPRGEFGLPPTPTARNVIAEVTDTAVAYVNTFPLSEDVKRHLAALGSDREPSSEDSEVASVREKMGVRRTEATAKFYVSNGNASASPIHPDGARALTFREVFAVLGIDFREYRAVPQLDNIFKMCAMALPQTFSRAVAQAACKFLDGSDTRVTHESDAIPPVTTMLAGDHFTIGGRKKRRISTWRPIDNDRRNAKRRAAAAAKRAEPPGEPSE